MQWAYSELFQNYTGAQVRWYLDYALAQSTQRGLYVHYSETHDNPRLAERGRTWSLLRNRLCALTSVSGAFGFTNGVEWLAPERVNVHSSRGLAWGHQPHLLRELGALNRLLADHPCFHDGARLTRLSGADTAVYALLRQSAEGQDAVLVLVNTDPDHTHSVSLEPAPSSRLASTLSPTTNRHRWTCSTSHPPTHPRRERPTHLQVASRRQLLPCPRPQARRSGRPHLPAPTRP
ncbi:MAG: hypothetical protein M5U12_33895 [Verrucomicrobia bacterium]|nr:hypothetical protein [Verrucomicrobiota bacterium]